MAKVYAELIRKGLKTLDDVPDDCARKSGVSLKKMRSRAYEAPSTFSFDYSVWKGGR